MSVPESIIAQVVTEVSNNMSDPQYISRRVTQFKAAQPHLTQYVLAYQSELSLADILALLFQTVLIHESIHRATGHLPSQLSFHDLDAAAQTIPTLEALAEREPDLASFILSNTTSDPDTNSDRAAQEKIDQIKQRILTHAAAALIAP